jgi:hypothetical protein
MALYACLPRAAIAHHIPVILLGENPAMQLGDLGIGSLDWVGNGMKNGNTVAGGPDQLLPPGVTDLDTIWYRFPSDEEMDWGKLKIVYLGYFWKDFTKVDNARFSILHGLQIRTAIPEETGSLYPFEALDEDFVIANQMMKYFKFGFGKVTDEVCEEIRFGRMTRAKAVELVKRFDGVCAHEYIERVCRYLHITEEQFWEVAERYRNKEIWEKVDGVWRLKVELR